MDIDAGTGEATNAIQMNTRRGGHGSGEKAGRVSPAAAFYRGWETRGWMG